MKRLFCFCITLALLLCLIPSYAPTAQAAAHGDETVYFEDGSYIVTSIEEVSTWDMRTKNYAKTRIYYDPDGVAEWKIILSGIFEYDGSSSTCTYSFCTVTIYNENKWREVSKTAEKYGSTASCTVTMGELFLGITVSTHVHTLTITCDKDGNCT